MNNKSLRIEGRDVASLIKKITNSSGDFPSDISKLTLQGNGRQVEWSREQLQAINTISVPPEAF